MAHKMPPMPALAPGRKVPLAEVVAGAVPPGGSVAVVGRLDASRTTPDSITLTAGGAALRVATAALSAEMLGALPHDGAVEVIGEVAGRPAAVHEESGGEEGGGVIVDGRVARLLVGYDEDLYARALRMREVFEARYGPGGTGGG
ncbi:hypothetical protein I4F81_000241 [Pyropia yezoensis]|uniref:Uncharacterized protein n=1 Tax=Pyropia yezoensis TaxID=2788 RepID=A0ACC3BIB2_PYRYE|nr:hypothetical protein I4F81_000241 [Neopyropia yezoensis]